MTKKPEPKIVSEVCSLCGLGWKRHGKEPTTETCIGLLLDEVRSLNAALAVRPISIPQPYPVPYPRPYPVLPRPWPYWQQTQWSNNTAQAPSFIPAAASVTPRALRAS